MTSEPELILQLARDSAVDRALRADPPPSVASGRVLLEHVPPEPDGRLGPPAAGEIVMSVLSPEALTREPDQVRDVISNAPDRHQPLVIIVQAAEELREDELAAVLDAAAGVDRPVIMRVIADA
ncbi:MAG TPA: hypothetical protein VIX86_11950 [Streptosporangiaceae bacterium]